MRCLFTAAMLIMFILTITTAVIQGHMSHLLELPLLMEAYAGVRAGSHDGPRGVFHGVNFKY